MLNDYSLIIIARERQEQILCEVAANRHAANMLPRVALLLAFITAAVSAAYSGDRNGALSGVVLDNRNRPVAGAAVFLTAVARRCTGKTDRTGRFAVRCVAGGGYTARVHKDGFRDSVLPNVGTVAGAVVDVGVVPLTPRFTRTASTYGG